MIETNKLLVSQWVIGWTMEASGWEVDRQNGMRDFWHQMVVPDLVNLEEKDVVKLHGFEILDNNSGNHSWGGWFGHFQTFHLLQFEKCSRHKRIAVYILSINIWRCLEDTGWHQIPAWPSCQLYLAAALTGCICTLGSCGYDHWCCARGRWVPCSKLICRAASSLLKKGDVECVHKGLGNNGGHGEFNKNTFK